MRKVTFVQWLVLSLLVLLAAFGFWLVNTGTVFAQSTDNVTVTFSDPNLEADIRQTIGKRTGSIYISDLEALTSLSADWDGISDVTGLEHCTSLKELHLGFNDIKDISPLAGLTTLEELDLSGNSISDISPLAGLPSLEELDLFGNDISDISPLAALTNLKHLQLGWNDISDISPLAGLTTLEELDLSGNGIRDISPLAGLINLEILGLSQNSISDISPMLSDRWLPRGSVGLRNNPLSTASRHLGIPLLQKRGIDVRAEELDWSFMPASLIALAGVGFVPICYLATSRRRKWLRPVAMVMGVTGAVLLALWLVPAANSYSDFGVSSVPEGIAVFLGIVACLIIVTGAAVGWRRELVGGALLIVGGLIAGVAYPLWLLHTPSILTLFPLVSGFLCLLSWRERHGRTTVEPIEKRPGRALLTEGQRHAFFILGIVILGLAGLFLFFASLIGLSMEPSMNYGDVLFVSLVAEAWCLVFACSILAARKYW